jgi:hypothetical protein
MNTRKNQIDIVKDIADGMMGIGGLPGNEEFYAEFDMRLKAALRIHVISKSVCDHSWMNTGLSVQGKSLMVCTKCRETKQTVCQRSAAKKSAEARSCFLGAVIGCPSFGIINFKTNKIKWN